MNMNKFELNRWYMGFSYRNRKEQKTVRVIKRTPQFVYYEIDNGTTGRCKIFTDYNGEYFMIIKENNLYVSATNIFN